MAEKQNQNDPWGAISAAVTIVGVVWAIAWAVVKVVGLILSVK